MYDRINIISNTNSTKTIKEEIILYKDNIINNKQKLNYKKEYINKGLNNIIISLSLLVIITLILLLKIGLW